VPILEGVIPLERWLQSLFLLSALNPFREATLRPRRAAMPPHTKNFPLLGLTSHQFRSLSFVFLRVKNTQK